MKAPRRLLALLFCILFVLPAAAQAPLQSPAAFLGYELGERFTPHHRVVDYVEHVASASPNVEIERYGVTYEGRPLMVAYIASPENLDRLEEIRRDNLRRAGVEAGAPAEDSPAIVWLSYNVHGNESVSSEAALATIYDLANTENARTQQWLESTVVVLDPMLNPDGRERYVQWYTRTAGQQPNVRPEAREHQEPWPGGRTNHYYFDLNRDWAWVSQLETRQRLALYNQWLPHVHVDFHEMGVDSPYYFAPAAEPFHEDITDWQREFQTTIGENNARYFDREGWLYYTREVFDLFYPGYGDTWPIYNGAIGMTYEQGGSGRAGLGILTAEGDTLTLRDRIDHHHVTSLSTVEATAQHADRVVEEFTRFHQQAQNDPPGDYATYVVKAGERPSRLDALAEHLDHQGIRYGFATQERSINGFDYRSGAEASGTVAPGDMIIPAAQPKGTLVKVLFEPRTTVIDSLTYDITAWSLPYAYDLDAYALTGTLNPDTGERPQQAPRRPQIDRPYAYLAEWSSTQDVRFLAQLLEEGIKLRFASQPFAVGGREYDRGTLIITRTGNEALGERFDRIVRETAQEHDRHLDASPTGFVEHGTDFGSNNVPFLDKPEVLVMAGEPASSYSVGEVWHYFDQQIDYPVTLIYPDDFSTTTLQDYDVLVLPSGHYGSVFSDDDLEALRRWIRSGGRLIALERAVSYLAGQDGFSVARKASAAAEDDEDAAPSDQLGVYAERQREAARRGVPGSIFQTRIDATHPLGFGFGDTYFTLKRGSDAYSFLENGWNVVALQEDAHVSGFTGSEALQQLENTLVHGVQHMGGGRVVYMVDNPLFRGFWESGKLLFGNAVFLVGQ